MASGGPDCPHLFAWDTPHPDSGANEHDVVLSVPERLCAAVRAEIEAPDRPHDGAELAGVEGVGALQGHDHGSAVGQGHLQALPLAQSVRPFVPSHAFVDNRDSMTRLMTGLRQTMQNRDYSCNVC